MNDERPTTDPWESVMSDELGRRAGSLHEAPLSFEHVHGRAMRIRRRRRVAVAGGVLAAAAIVVPVGVIAADRLEPVRDGRDDSDLVATEAPTDGIGLSYLEGTTWHRSDGTTVDLDRGYDGGTELGDDLLAVRTDTDTGQLTIDVVGPDGEVAESTETWSYPVANDDHTTVAYIATDGSLMTRWDGGEVALGDGFADGDSVAALSGGPSCLETEGGGCVAVVDHGDGSAPEVLDSHGIRDVVAEGVLSVNDVAGDGRIAAQTESTIDGSCSALLGVAPRAPLWETCDYSLEQFSPGGAHLSGTDAYRDGAGQGYVVILDASDGTELARWEATNGFAFEWAWEDEAHLLINAYEQGEWHLHRLGVDGTLEESLATSTEGDDMLSPFRLLR